MGIVFQIVQAMLTRAMVAQQSTADPNTVDEQLVAACVAMTTRFHYTATALSTKAKESCLAAETVACQTAWGGSLAITEFERAAKLASHAAQAWQDAAVHWLPLQQPNAGDAIKVVLMALKADESAIERYPEFVMELIQNNARFANASVEAWETVAIAMTNSAASVRGCGYGY